MTNQITFRGKHVNLDEDPKRGVCNICRYVVGEAHPITGKVYQRSHMHHVVYDENNPEAHTIEVCPCCHPKLTWEGHEPNQPSGKKKLIKVYPDVHEVLTSLFERRGDTYDIIIRRLINFYEEHRQKK